MSNRDLDSDSTMRNPSALPVSTLENLFHFFLTTRTTLWELDKALSDNSIDFVVIGDLATAAHGAGETTANIELSADAKKLNRLHDDRRWIRSSGKYGNVVLDSQTGLSVNLRSADTRINHRLSLCYPDPSEAVEIEGMKTVSLPGLIELKLVTWRFKDWSDVVALIRANKLDESFADKLNPLVRMAYIECYDQMIEEDKYSPEG